MPKNRKKVKKFFKKLTFYVDKTKKIVYNVNCKLNEREEKNTIDKIKK